MGQAPPEPGGEPPEWLVKALTALGVNEVKLRWRLRRWHNDWRKFRRRGEQRADQVRYANTVCPGCGALNARGDKLCRSCGAKLPSRLFVVLDRLGLAAPSFLTVSAIFGLAMAVVYLRLIVANQGGGIVSLPGELLFVHGGYVHAALAQGEGWRALTAVFLHGGLWHLAFNLLSLAFIGPRVEALYGRMATAALFIVTGVAGFVGGGFLGVTALTIGASGAVMGLIGAAAGWGHRDGSGAGRALRNDMIKWLIYVTVFGLMLNANHAAHFVGFAVGAGFGYGVRPGVVTAATARPAVLALGIAAFAAGGWATYAALVPPSSELTTSVSDPSASARALVDACELHAAGRDAEAFDALPAPLRDREYDGGRDAWVATVCAEIRMIEGMCGERLPLELDDELRKQIYRICAIMREDR